MRKRTLAFILGIALLLGRTSGLASDIDILALLDSTQYRDYTVSHMVENNPPVEGLMRYALVTLQKDEENALAVFVKDGAKWKLGFVNKNALYRGADLPKISIDDHSNEITIAYLQDGKNESYVFRTNERLDSISWLLARYNAEVMRGAASRPWNCFYDELQETWGTSTYDPAETNMYKGDIARDMSQFDIAKMPKGNEEMSKLLSHVSSTSLDDKSSTYDASNIAGLSGEIMPFKRGETIAVYSGPGLHYLRAASGKAAVGTNGDIEVWGEDNGWALIRYQIDSKNARFGYVPIEYVIVSVTPLENSFAIGVTTCESNVTDDPMLSENTLRTLKAGTPIDIIAFHGDWAYIDDSMSNEPPCRGFIPAANIEFTANF